jgi:hypothetical protein
MMRQMWQECQHVILPCGYPMVTCPGQAHLFAGMVFVLFNDGFVFELFVELRFAQSVRSRRQALRYPVLTASRRSN